MSITLYDLYHQSKRKYKLKLIAGEEGLKNVISWAQFTEDIMTVNFLKGGELVLTTGLKANGEATTDENTSDGNASNGNTSDGNACDGNTNGKTWIHEFIQELINQKSTGLIINVGNYIEEDSINDEIKELCNNHQFPLIVMPWDIHLSDIMQDYCNQILSDSKYQDNVTAALKGIILQPNQETTYLDELNTYGFYQNETYGIMAIHLIDSKKLWEKSKRIFIHITNLLNESQLNFHMFYNDITLMVIMHRIDSQSVEKIVTKLEKYNPISAIGVGDISETIHTISLSYHQAIAALDVAHYKAIKKCYFESLGMYRILFFVSDKNILQKIVKESLGALEEYDKTRSSSLLETLELYVQYDGSIQLVADKTFTHRNTINYRMKKIKELLNDEINTMDSKFKLQMAFHIKNYLQNYM